MSRTVAVTGSASGIGRATARLLRERGETVIGVDLHDAEVCTDLATRDGRRTAVDRVAHLAADGLDALVTCAGLSRAGAAQVSVNYFGTTELITGLQPLLAMAPAPRVAAVGSIAATHPHDAGLVATCRAHDEQAGLARAEELVADGRPHEVYPSTKAALAQWLRRTAVTEEYAGAGIALNAVAPGVVLSPMTAELVADPEWRKVMDAAVPMPLGGHSSPETIAHALLWLIAPENTHMAGQVVHVDGGAEAVTVGR